MDGLEAVELQGQEREQVLAAIEKQIAEWGLTMPDVVPLPLHFGLNRFMETGETEFWIANEEESGYCGKFLFVFDGQTCPYHSHNVKHETFFVVKGSIKMIADSSEKVMKEGDLFVMNPGVKHSFTGIGPALVLEISMPSTLGDNFFADSNIGDNGVI